MIVFTDGKSFSDVSQPAQKLKNLGVVIFSIGVGSGIDETEVRTMASSPADDHVILLDSFNEFSYLAQNMSFRTCNGKVLTIIGGNEMLSIQ